MRIPVVVVGAGQAGLAMSHQLVARSIDHVVLDKGQVAQSWRSERWDSLRLLTPNWMSRLPGRHDTGPDRDGFMTKDETIALLECFGNSFGAPVRPHVTVEAVTARATGFDVVTDTGTWRCDAVVAASGSSSEPRVPALAADLPLHIRQLTALEYRNPDQLGTGAVLVVGASASGVQIADELQRHGRETTLAVGEHVRLPRMYRGRDIHWWMDVIGHLDERHDEVDDIVRARRLPSPQLIGTPEHRTLDLNSLAAAGVQAVGKLMRVNGSIAQFSGALANILTSADLKQQRLLERIDQFVIEHRLDAGLGDPSRPERTHLRPACTELDLTRFETVVWATGYQPMFRWLDRGAFDHRNRLVHNGGVCAMPGLYVLGLPFLRRRKSSFIDGVGPDAAELASHLHAYLDRRARA